jgi:hypothetical protein
MNAADQAESEMFSHEVQSGHNLEQGFGIIDILGPVGSDQQVPACFKV